MTLTTRAARLIALSLLGASIAAMAAPVDQIRARIAGYKEMGRAFKQVNDGLRGGTLPPPVAQQAAQRIALVARSQYGWFPAGSGPQPGVKTAAKREIWAKPRDFRAAQDNFARAAGSFQRAAGTNNGDLIRGEARKLGAACKQCHDTFRESDD